MLQLAQLVIEAHMEKDGKVICDCGRELGTLIEMDDRTFLQIGDTITWSLHGSCVCGRPLHFATSDKILERILARQKGFSKKYLEMID
jgi:hypothetical protein